MDLAALSLDDKYTAQSGQVFITGIQALVRLPMMQRRLDLAAGLNTAGFVSGYRGSPLGVYDQQLWRAKSFLDDHHVEIRPAVNEDLAATAVWGSQQLQLFPGARYDGVFGLWYGKGPGVDRSGDVIKHGNLAGAAATGGVLAVAGDDHTCKSSTTAHQSEYAFMDASVPVLNPSSVQEYLDYGLFGWAASRYSGCWVAMKAISETVESSAVVDVDPARFAFATPEDFTLPDGGLNIRWPDPPLDQEARLHRYKIYAARAFAHANNIDRTVIDSPTRRLGIITTGKSYLDVRQALDDLGIDDERAAEIGLSVYKVGMSWPLEPEGARRFCEGLEEVLVVEEKRAVIENQLKEQLYNWRTDVRPRVVGKFNEAGDWILPSIGELTPARIARVIAGRISRFFTSEHIDQRLEFLAEKERALEHQTASLARIPYFCSGCPHNRSTVVPEGSRAVAGIGCHYMVTWMDRRNDTFTHMGGEGVNWVGHAPFTDENHVFVNLGDGTYYHSGLLAIRQTVAANVNVTFKILYNDAVAMTGGQPVDGPLSVPQITRQLAAEGVRRTIVVSDQPDIYPVGADFAPHTAIRHRDDLDAVQRELRDISGTTALIYDQTCAAEKRRRRKRNEFPDPPKRVVINQEVCEGCGDCAAKSNCLSVIPVETEFGRKRAIDQSSCNKDYSCLDGYCPSLVTVEGGTLRRPTATKREAEWTGDVLEPSLPALDDPYGILVTGIGGTGVVTIGALLGVAAHMEGKGATILDMTGLAQKGGAVTSHIRIADHPENIHAVRIAAGRADLVLACDMVVAAGHDTLSKIHGGTTRAVVNTHRAPTGAFTQNSDLAFPEQEMEQRIADATGPDATVLVDGTRLATALLGDSIATNVFMLGFAWQRGLVPLSAASIERAIELNGVAVASNKKAFLWGRRAAHDVEQVARLAAPTDLQPQPVPERSLDDLIAHRANRLTDYQNAALATRYRAFVDKVRAAETAVAPTSTALTGAVARYYYKLLAVKDEYEVARLFTNGTFAAQVNRLFEGDYKLRFHMAPPLFAPRDPVTGEPQKRAYGPRMFTALRVLAKLRFLRGTVIDPFRHIADHRLGRRLQRDYVATIEGLLPGLTPLNLGTAVQIAELPEHIRGYGHVRRAHLAKVEADQTKLLAAFNQSPMSEAAE